MNNTLVVEDLLKIKNLLRDTNRLDGNIIGEPAR